MTSHASCHLYGYHSYVAAADAIIGIQIPRYFTTFDCFVELRSTRLSRLSLGTSAKSTNDSCLSLETQYSKLDVPARILRSVGGIFESSSLCWTVAASSAN